MLKTVLQKVFLLAMLSVHMLLLAQHKWDFKIYNKTIGTEIYIYAENSEPMPMSVKFDFQLENLLSSLPSGEIVVVPALTHLPIAKITMVKANAPNSFQYTATYNFGDALVEEYDADYAYALPFQSGKSYRVFQGYNGSLSHHGQLALDFNLKEGNEVYAAREGMVVKTEDAFHQNCPRLDCAKYNNYILILHSDDTFAEYSHLKQKGVLVKKGDHVEKNQLIGYSGNTGYSTGPHLHFAVFFNQIDGKRSYVPTCFKTSEEDCELLKEKKTYTKNY